MKGLSYVPMKYSHQTRIGNWSEEWELEQIKTREYDRNKQQNILPSQKTGKQIDTSLQKASITYSNDGNLCFGDHIMFANIKTKGILVNNIWESLQNHIEAFGVTTATGVKPCTRSIFVLERCSDDHSQDNYLRYGQKFLIRANPRLVKGKFLYLSSSPVTPTCHSKVSRLQEVCITTKESFHNTFSVDHPDPKSRFEMRGQLVPANTPVLIVHSYTQQFLASDLNVQKNVFGSEYEVVGHSFLNKSKGQNLVAEKSGRTTIDVSMRFQEDQNLWAICTAKEQSKYVIQNQDEQFNEVVLDKLLSVDDVIIKMKYFLQDKGEYSLASLRQSLKKLDQKNNSQIDADDFKWGLRSFGIHLNQDELQMIYDLFDQNKTQFLNYNNFLNALRGEVSPQRVNLINKTYQALNQQQNLTLQTLALQYDAKSHPDVLNGLISEEAAFKLYMSFWEDNQQISQQKFLNFYLDISGLIDNQEYFEFLISKTLKI